MGIARDLLRQVKAGIRDRIMGRYGDRVVSSLADTSSDAPSRFSAPKRDLYDQLQADGRVGKTDGKADGR